MSDLRTLAERSKSTAAVTPDAWYRAGEISRLLTALTGHAAMADDDADFIVAASPNVVLGLLDRIAALEEALREIAEWDKDHATGDWTLLIARKARAALDGPAFTASAPKPAEGDAE